MTATRWYCHACAREWLSNASAVGVLKPWDPEHGCPGCSSTAIELVTYTPAFPGGDIPRAGTPRIDSASRIQIVEAPPAHITPPPAVLEPEGDDFEGVPV